MTALPNTYWVVPGKLLAGEYPGGVEGDAVREPLEQLLAAGIDCFVDLTMPDELPSYEPLLPRHVDHVRLPIRDHSLPAEPAHMAEILETLQSFLREGRCIYLHCRAGIGRTGTVAGCLLVEQGLTGEAALESLNQSWSQCARAQYWPRVPETQEQIEYVRRWEPRAGPDSALRERFLGTLVGLAVGDALASGGDARELPAGAWSDDTAIALCLAESLVRCKRFDPRDQIERIGRWHSHGHLSATGRCAGITPSTERALAAARWRRQRFAGSHEPRRLDSEPLSRVAPCVLFAYADPAEAVRLAAEAARLTCQAPMVLGVCRIFAAMLHAAVAGKTKVEVLAPERGLAEPREHGVPAKLRSLLEGRYRAKERSQLRAGPGILDALEAALWAFDHTSEFAEGARVAANLTGRSDVVAAAYGQLAGAFYGFEGIPAPWRSALARLELVAGFAEELFALGTAGTGAPRVE